MVHVWFMGFISGGGWFWIVAWTPGFEPKFWAEGLMGVVGGRGFEPCGRGFAECGRSSEL